MKQAVLLIYAFTVITVLAVGDDVIEKLAYQLDMTRTEVQTCYNKSNILPEDLSNTDQMIEDYVHTMSIDRSALKIGCFVACIFQKKKIISGGYIDTDKIIELSDNKINTNPWLISLRMRVLKICTNRVRSKTNECEVSIKFLLCLINQIKRTRIEVFSISDDDSMIAYGKIL